MKRSPGGMGPTERPSDEETPQMRLILTFFAIGAAAYVLSRKKGDERAGTRAAFADGQPSAGSNPVRDAGPEAMRDGQARTWSSVDEASDQSFPASDPPSTY